MDTLNKTAGSRQPMMAFHDLGENIYTYVYSSVYIRLGMRGILIPSTSRMSSVSLLFPYSRLSVLAPPVLMVFCIQTP